MPVVKIKEESKPCQEEKVEEEQDRDRVAPRAVDAGEQAAVPEGQEAVKAQG
ncbi:MAG: hypothetical protein NTY36_00095 [Deltaproteobacteria bacterium]|nr:hypothetical protein [Deltaproteobacteria bacterium]